MTDKLFMLIIDPQRDFCDPDGALAVPGADKDMTRLAEMIRRIGDNIAEIHCTLDTHHFFDISHPVFWINSEGKSPDPFTIITVDDVRKGRWKTSRTEHQSYSVKYVSALAENRRYPLCIWPPHCLIGTKGHNIFPVLSDALTAWEKQQLRAVDCTIKGSNYKTEHYSAIQADVPDADDPSTMMNETLLKNLQKADMLLLAGEALSHCVKFTVEDIAEELGETYIRKMVLIEDCASSVPGFEKQGADFVKEMCAKGMRISNSVDFFA